MFQTVFPDGLGFEPVDGPTRPGRKRRRIWAIIGHSSPVVTRRFYDHFVRKTFSPGLRQGLGLGPEAEGKVLALPKR